MIPASAFLLGFLGSLHCAGMCGPIALLLRGHGKTRGIFFLHRLLYNSGRVVTYSLMGAAAGAAGMFFHWAGWQQFLSVALGILLLVTAPALIPGAKNQFLRPLAPLFERVTGGLGHLISQQGNRNMLAIGLLNGWLPCGLVYSALALAATSDTVMAAAGYMFLFGLGTFPMMLMISFSGKLLSIHWRTRVMRWYPYLSMLLGALLILRGLDLGIPFLSPELSSGKAAACHGSP
jgi:hypothetical protein